jgi:hypothetical protein
VVLAKNIYKKEIPILKDLGAPDKTTSQTIKLASAEANITIFNYTITISHTSDLET